MNMTLQPRFGACRTLPLEAGALHAAVGDGSLNVLPGLAQYPAVMSELHRALEEQGRLVIRCFIRPDMAEAVTDVVDAALEGRVRRFHAFKWRLAMACTGPSSASVSVSDIHEMFETHFPSRRDLSRATGWPKDQIDTIDAYRASPTHYTFPTLGMLREKCQLWFDIVAEDFGTYELAERCPTLTLVRKAWSDCRE